MTKTYLLVGILVATLVAVLLGMSGIVDASALTFAKATEKPTRDRTQNPRQTKTPTADAAATATPEGTVPAEPTVDAEALAASQLSSQLLLLNPDRGGRAEVSVSVYDAAGAVAFSDSFKLKENGAKIVTLPKEVGVDFMGSARIVADRRIQALVLDASGDGSASDAYEGVRGGATTVTLPYLQHLASATQNSLVAVQNTSAETANATFTAYDVAGNAVLSEPLSIPARASVYLKTDDLFGNTPFVGSAVITGDQTLAAAELTVDKQDTASMRAYTAQDQGVRVLVPGVERKRNKKGVLNAWNAMYVRNQGAAAADIQVEYYNAKGDKVGTVMRSNVPAGGLAVLNTGDAEFQFLGTKFSGWTSVESTGDTPLLVHALAAQGRGKQLIGLGGVARPQINGRSVCGDVRTTGKATSTLTLSNARAKDAVVVRVRLYEGAEGTQVAELDVPLAGNTQVALTTKNGLPSNFQGIALVGVVSGDSRSVLAMVTTRTRDGKIKSTSGYVCR